MNVRGPDAAPRWFRRRLASVRATPDDLCDAAAAVTVRVRHESRNPAGPDRRRRHVVRLRGDHFVAQRAAERAGRDAPDQVQHAGAGPDAGQLQSPAAHLLDRVPRAERQAARARSQGTGAAGPGRPSPGAPQQSVHAVVHESP